MNRTFSPFIKIAFVATVFRSRLIAPKFRPEAKWNVSIQIGYMRCTGTLCTVCSGYEAVTNVLLFIKIELRSTPVTEHLRDITTHRTSTPRVWMKTLCGLYHRKWICWCTQTHIHGPMLTPSSYHRRDLLHIWFDARRFDESKHLNLECVRPHRRWTAAIPQ